MWHKSKFKHLNLRNLAFALKWFPLGKSNATLPLENVYFILFFAGTRLNFSVCLRSFSMNTRSLYFASHLLLWYSLRNDRANTNLSLLKFNEYQRRTARAHHKMINALWRRWSSISRPYLNHLNGLEFILCNGLNPNDRTAMRMYKSQQNVQIKSTFQNRQIHY